MTGLPWTATAQIPSLTPEGQRVLLEARGSRRLSSQKLLDLRLSKTHTLGRAVKLSYLLDVLNVLNSHAKKEWWTITSLAKLRRPKVFVDPRRAMLGVRFILGR